VKSLLHIHCGVDTDQRLSGGAADRGAEAVGWIAVRDSNVTQDDARMPGATTRSFTPEGCLSSDGLGIVDGENNLCSARRGTKTTLHGGLETDPCAMEDELRASLATADVRVIGISPCGAGVLVCASIARVEGGLATGGRDVLLHPERDGRRYDSGSRSLLRYLSDDRARKVKQRELECLGALDHTAMSD
jgi:hypothetical protein